MSKVPEKYNQIVSTAKDLFWRYGFKRVTIEEVCTRANVSKMTFYKYFSNKNQLVEKIIDQVFDVALKKYESIMHSDKPFPEKVKEMVLLKIESTNDISKEFLDDYYNNADQELQEHLQKKTADNISNLMKDMIDAQSRGDIRQDIKPEFIIYFLNHLVVMGNDISLSSNYTNAQEMILELTNFFFYGILPREQR